LVQVRVRKDQKNKSPTNREQQVTQMTSYNPIDESPDGASHEELDK
jgi:hypothetical protein